MSELTHTPTPWETVPQPDGSWLLKTPSRHHEMGPGVVGTESGVIVGCVYERKDAELIVRACNCHGKLAEACRAALYLLGTDADRAAIGERPWLPDGAEHTPHMLRAAIAKVEES